MREEVICATGRYVVVMYTRWHEEPQHELRYLVLDRRTASVGGSPFGFLDAERAKAFAAELNEQETGQRATDNERGQGDIQGES